MGVTVQCLSCKLDQEVEDELAGSNVRCKKCGRAIYVPVGEPSEELLDSYPLAPSSEHEEPSGAVQSPSAAMPSATQRPHRGAVASGAMYLDVPVASFRSTVVATALLLCLCWLIVGLAVAAMYESAIPVIIALLVVSILCVGFGVCAHKTCYTRYGFVKSLDGTLIELAIKEFRFGMQTKKRTINIQGCDTLFFSKLDKVTAAVKVVAVCILAIILTIILGLRGGTWESLVQGAGVALLFGGLLWTKLRPLGSASVQFGSYRSGLQPRSETVSFKSHAAKDKFLELVDRATDLRVSGEEA